MIRAPRPHAPAAALALLLVAAVAAPAGAQERLDASVLEAGLAAQLGELLGVPGMSADCPDDVALQRGATFRCEMASPELPGVEIAVSGTLVDDEGRYEALIHDPRAERLLLPVLREVLAHWNAGDLDAVVSATDPDWRESPGGDLLAEYLACRRATLGPLRELGKPTGHVRLTEADPGGALQVPLEFEAGPVRGWFGFYRDDEGRWRIGTWDIQAAPPGHPLPSPDALEPLAEETARHLYAGEIDALPARLVARYSRRTLAEQSSAIRSFAGPLRRVGEGSVEAGENGTVLLSLPVEAERGRHQGTFEFHPCGEEWQLVGFHLVAQETGSGGRPATVAPALLESKVLAALQGRTQSPAVTAVRCPGIEAVELRQGAVYRCVAELAEGETTPIRITMDDDAGHFTVSFGEE